MRPSLSILVLMILLLGCGKSEPAGEAVPIDQVPENLMKTARKELPNVTFDRASKRPNGVWVIRGKTSTGKVREIEMDPSGKVLEIE
jgi:hypothetical protein